MSSLEDYLAENDAPCPGCGYNLRGLREARCPECSYPFKLDKIQPLSETSIERMIVDTLCWLMAIPFIFFGMASLAEILYRLPGRSDLDVYLVFFVCALMVFLYLGPPRRLLRRMPVLLVLVNPVSLTFVVVVAWLLVIAIRDRGWGG